MSIQLIICMETRKSANTDWVYIKEALEHFTIINDEIKLSPVFMKSKGLFMTPKALRKIDIMSKQYKFGPTYVIFCADTDDIWANIDAIKENKAIESFCIAHKFYYVWMCRDVEDVFWGHTVQDRNKVTEAGAFRRKEMISQIDVKNLRSKSVQRRHSNLLLVIEQCVGKERMRGENTK